MFKLQKNPTFTHAVTVMVPVDGGHDPQELTVRYRVVEMESVDRMISMKTQDITDFLKAAVVEVSDLVDDNDAPLPWSDTLRDRLFAIYYIRIALVNGYIRAVMKARLGN